MTWGELKHVLFLRNLVRKEKEENETFYFFSYTVWQCYLVVVSRSSLADKWGSYTLIFVSLTMLSLILITYRFFFFFFHSSMLWRRDLKLKDTKGPLHGELEMQWARNRFVTKALSMRRASSPVCVCCWWWGVDIGRSTFSHIKISSHHIHRCEGKHFH